MNTDISHIERTVLAHRYLYYVKALPILTDFDYDALEKEARKVLPPDSPVHLPGSDLAASYPPIVILHAGYLFGKHHESRHQPS